MRDDSGAVVQATQTAIMLNSQYRSGDSQSLAYSHLYQIEFTNDTTLKLTFSDHQVVVSGRRFGELDRRLQLQRVLQICDAGVVVAAGQGSFAAGDATYWGPVRVS
ncbi:hypothetical protein Fuma_04157 [Fuerstiella marisgermanici]|uniref:Uncharacterized protein n=2 Tax=Fuerstiella marisgermanici TaxID=1891926 RepID=A0A1P8WKD7_9PLAN|nr:hypothetical protein Fuma_04157 [Fuerstiella marisgermanici]